MLEKKDDLLKGGLAEEEMSVLEATDDLRD
jgi:hypothetical protein